MPKGQALWIRTRAGRRLHVHIQPGYTEKDLRLLGAFVDYLHVLREQQRDPDIHRWEDDGGRAA